MTIAAASVTCSKQPDAAASGSDTFSAVNICTKPPALSYFLVLQIAHPGC